MAKARRSDPLRGWATFGLPAFAAALAPWQDKITRAELIPIWYQPRLGLIASVLGPLVCFCLWLTCDRLKRRALIRLCLGSLAAFVAALLACLWLDAVVDISWFPDLGTQPLLSLAWQLLYLLAFAAFASAIVTGLLLRK
jgi:hypothetical protein